MSKIRVTKTLVATEAELTVGMLVELMAGSLSSQRVNVNVDKGDIREPGTVTVTVIEESNPQRVKGA